MSLRLPEAVREATCAYILVACLCLLTVANVLGARLSNDHVQLLVGAATTALVPIAVTVFFSFRRPYASADTAFSGGWRLQQFLVTFIPAALVYGYATLTQRNTPIWTVLGVPAASSATSGDTIFLDLAHLVDAANCQANVTPGQIVCDRLDRAFNQNPLWVDAGRPVLRAIHLHSLGILLALCFITGVALLATMRPSAQLLAIPMLFSPSVALGIERGQPDLFVWLFATSGVLLLSRSRVGLNLLGVALLAAATVLKVFPALLLLPFLALPGSKRRVLSAVGLVVTGVYWLASRDMLFTMLQSTQRGRERSYGLATMLPDVLANTREQVIAAAIIIAVLAGGGLLARNASTRPAYDQAVPAAFACFYLGSFFAGANWSYRLVLALMLVGQVRLPIPRFEVVKQNDVFRLDGLLVLTAVSLLWLTPVLLGAVWQLAVAVVSTAILLVLAAGTLRNRGAGEPFLIEIDQPVSN
jgi:hypothetical protein